MLGIEDKLIFIMALFSLWNAVYSPLAGAYFNIAPFNISQNVSVLLDGAGDPSFFYDTSGSSMAAAGVCYRCLIRMFGLDTDS